MIRLGHFGVCSRRLVMLGRPVVGLSGRQLLDLPWIACTYVSVGAHRQPLLMSLLWYPLRPCGRRAPGGSCGPGGSGFRLPLRGWLLPHRGERLQFLGLWVTRWSSWWLRGVIRVSPISTVVASCLAIFSCTHFHMLQLLSMLVWRYGFSAGGTGACFPQKLIIVSSFLCGWRPLFRQGRPRQGAYPPWIGVSPVLGGGWGWNIPLCVMGATSGRGSLLVPSSNPKVARQGERYHDDVIKWKHFLCNWPFVLGIHRSLVNSPHKGQWRRALMFSLICVWINEWVNNCEAGDLRCCCAHYDVIVMGPGWFCHGTFQPVLSGPWLSSML